eukprot:179432_1
MMSCLTRPAVIKDAEISQELECDRRKDRYLKQILAIGPNACSVFYQIQKHYNSDMDGDHLDEKDVDEMTVNTLIYGFINETLQSFGSPIMPYDIYDLIIAYFPINACFVINSTIVEHSYVMDRCNWKLLHIHDCYANQTFLNKIIYYHQCFSFITMIVYCVSLLICEDKDQLFEALDVYDYLINSRAHRHVCISVLFDDYEEFIHKTQTGEIMIGELVSDDDVYCWSQSVGPFVSQSKP